MSTQNIIMIGTSKSLKTLFRDLHRSLPEDSPDPFTSFGEDYTHIKLWPDIGKIDLYSIEVSEDEKEECKILNANLPSHRKHAINIVKNWD